MKQVILVEFNGGGVMPFYAERGSLRTGDLVIIETNKGKYKVVNVKKIEGISIKIAKKAKKWIVQKLDLTEYKKRYSAKKNSPL